MSSPQNTTTTLEKIESLIKKIWLANLGVCSRSLDEIQNRYERLSNDGQRIFDDLVNRGKGVESEARESLDNNRKQLEQRIARIKQRLTFQSSFSKQLDELNSKLDELVQVASKA